MSRADAALLVQALVFPIVITACGDRVAPALADPSDASEPSPIPAPPERECLPGQIPIGYQVRDLGTHSRDNEGLANASAINDLGQVVGIAEEHFYDSSRYDTHAFIWNGGNEAIERIPGTDTLFPDRAMDVNETGGIVGAAMARSGDGSLRAAAFYSDGDLPAVPIGELDGPFREAMAINESGLVVGFEATTGAFVWDARTHAMLHQGVGLPRPEPSESGFRDINDRDVAVGWSRDERGNIRALHWSAEAGAVALPIPGPTGASARHYADARGINAAGTIVVEASYEGASPCLLYRQGEHDRPVDLGILQTAIELDTCMVEAINDDDWVVGADSSGAVPALISRAWLWIEGGKHDLTEMLPSHQQERWRLTTATDVNNDGVVVGIGIHHEIPGRAFVATPVCGEPPRVAETGPTVPEIPPVRSYCRADGFTVTELPLPQGGTGAKAYGLDERGRVVGEAFLRGGTVVATAWVLGEAFVFEEQRLRMGRTGAYDINDDGVVVGFGLHRFDSLDLAPKSFSWSLGGAAPSSFSGIDPTRFWAIDDSGSAAGVVDSELAYYSPSRGLRRLGLVAGPTVESTGPVLSMNDAGDVVGALWLEERRAPFVWSESDDLTLLDRGDADRGEAFAVNDVGTIVGSLRQNESPPAPTLWSGRHSAPMMLPLAVDTRGGEARSINVHGEVVGWDGEDATQTDARAWLYRDGEMQTLDDLVDAPGLRLRVAYAVNDAGQIVGYGDRDGVGPLPFLLSPRCE